MTPEQQKAIRTARSMLELGHPLEVILSSGLIPPEYRDFVRTEIERDQNFPLVPARTIVADRSRSDWVAELDRSAWCYWPALRSYLLTTKNWATHAIRSLDDCSDRVMRELEPPSVARFDIRGLVLGYIQSGKTANYTALIAKAADSGYRLVVVLSGIDNGLRRQTNIRLKKELVGYPDNRLGAVPIPPMGQQWHEFTREDLEGDFQPGFANHAALQGSQPVLLVVKKNGPVLRRLLRWLDDAPLEIRQTLPMLLIDDEADQASVDVRGSYQVEEDPVDEDYEPPSVINRLIRDLLQRFDRRAYVAYTATPFANILIPHDTFDPSVCNDLYPKDFIVDLPKPSGHFGAEEFFGRIDPATGADVPGLDVIREVALEDVSSLLEGGTPESLIGAIENFVLAGAARAARGEGSAPATMLLHTSQRVLVQAHLREIVGDLFAELRDEWRYQRRFGIRKRLQERWEREFRPVTQSLDLEKDAEFPVIEPHIGPFIEAVQVKEINSATGDVLDYEREPSLKAIAVGGNRLSRGLTLEGLLVSFFVRRSMTYDTLMQMGRWFGFRGGYQDLTRIHTTLELAQWFSELAFVEHRLREDIQVYESQGLTPYQVGMRIWQHPTMQVTSRIKRRFSATTVLSQSYSLTLEQIFKFPFDQPGNLAIQAETNLQGVRTFVRRLGASDPLYANEKGPVWTGISCDEVLTFLNGFAADPVDSGINLPLVCAYIERAVAEGELVRWVVAVRGVERLNETMGSAEWNLPDGPVFQIERTRLNHTNSLGVITNPGDEEIGLSEEILGKAQASIREAQARGEVMSRNVAARAVRPADEGLLLLYPISRYSGCGGPAKKNRGPLYDDPDGGNARDLVGLAISFPRSNRTQPVEAYVEGTVRWRPVE